MVLNEPFGNKHENIKAFWPRDDRPLFFVYIIYNKCIYIKFIMFNEYKYITNVY